LNSHGKKALAARVWCCGQKFDKHELLFIGVLGPTCRGDGVLHFLSINRTLIRLRLEDFWKGMNFGLDLVWKPNFLVGLTRLRTRVSRVKAFSLSGSCQVTGVRSGPGRVTGLRRIPYPEAVGLAGLG
jgi:hypothetical protein